MTQGPRKSAHDYDQELLALFDAYVHGDIDRRRFLERAAKFAVGGVTAAMLLDELSPDFAAAQVVPPDDARLRAERVEIPSPAGHGTDARLLGAAGGGRGASSPACWSSTRTAVSTRTSRTSPGASRSPASRRSRPTR